MVQGAPLNSLETSARDAFSSKYNTFKTYIAELDN